MSQIKPHISLEEAYIRLTDLCGRGRIFKYDDSLRHYGGDETLDLHFPFDILAKPASNEQVAAVVRFCHEHRIPVTPRGGGSGVTGGALAIQGGVLLSLEKLDRIIEINEMERYVVAESGVVTDQLCRAVEAKGLYFPVIPGSSAFSLVGGNVAQNAGSIQSCKYGNTAQYVVNLEVVLPSGDIIWTGANFRKNSTGLNLTPLFIGSQGILGVITKVVYTLIALPKKEVSLLAAFESLKDAFDTVSLIRKSRIMPAAAELICKDALTVTSAYLNEKPPLVDDKIEAHLLINLHGHDDHEIEVQLESLVPLIEKKSVAEVLLASSSKEKEHLWKLRNNIGAALTKDNSIYRDIDICLPLAKLPAFVNAVMAIANKCGVKAVCFGHVLDGNLHCMLLIGNSAVQRKAAEVAAGEIYEYAISRGGIISGEHGIGILQKEFMQLQFSVNQLTLMREIKKMMDPHCIMNPGKVI